MKLTEIGAKWFDRVITFGILVSIIVAAALFLVAVAFVVGTGK